MTVDLDALEALAKAATPGPWIADPPTSWDTDDSGGYLMQASVRVKDGGSITWDDHGGEVFKPEDADFIAAANPLTVLALISELRQEWGRAKPRVSELHNILAEQKYPGAET